jgi:hypothetical protein
MVYTKSEAIEILLSGATPAHNVARIVSERVNRKYYLITAYTPYVGEEMEAYFSSCDEESMRAFGDELASDCAAEWADHRIDDWEENGYDSREDAEEDYYANCGYRVREVPKEEYASAPADSSYWVMRKE